MNAPSAFAQLEAQLTGSNVFDLSTAKRAEPIKTAQELKNEWRKQRLGKFTASEFSRLVTYPNKPNELPAGAKTFAVEKAIELLTIFNEEETYISPEMQWGLDHELDAIEAFTAKTGKTVEKTGPGQEFITLNDDIGCTPDGLVGKTGGIEVKCPKSTTHFHYLTFAGADCLKSHKPEYYWQIQGSLWITKRKRWWFVSFDPRFKHEQHRLKIVAIDRNPTDIAFLKKRLKMAIAHRNRLLKDMK